MSSTELPKEGSLGLEQSRRSTRDRKQPQYFGFPGSDSQSKEPERAIVSPSLIIKLSLPSILQHEAVQLPPCREVQAPHINPVEKRGFGVAIDSEEGPEKSTPLLTREPAIKRQRRAPRTPRTPLSTQENKCLFKPRGQPEVWAESRHSLCDSLPYYHSTHAAAYAWGGSSGFAGYVYGYLLDNDNEKYGYMDEKVVITRLGGGMKASKDGTMKQIKDHSILSQEVTPLLNNKNDRVPLILIVGAKNSHCPVQVPHRYNVLGVYHVTDVWSEKVNGLVVCRARFEMLDLSNPSWFGFQGTPLPPVRPDFTTKTLIQTCSSCQVSSKQVFAAGWACLNETCTKFSTVNVIIPGARAWNPAFLNERNQWPAHIKAPMPIKPAPPTAPMDGSLMETSLKAWKGMVCPHCGRCNSRTKWDEWKCGTAGCQFEIPIRYSIIPWSELAPDHAFEAEGHSIPFDKCMEPVVRTKSAFRGWWREMRFDICPGNFVIHYIANRVINRQPGGADEMLESLQGEKLGMQRFPMKSCAVEGEMVTNQFGMNFGLPYKYVVAVHSRSFSEAPKAITNALNHLTWAGKDAITDGSYRPFNGLLCLGYMEKQKIGWHDDGEKDLGPDIASLSLGGAATMTFRMKAKYYLAKDLTPKNYDPELPVQKGSQAWKLREATNEHFKAGRVAEYQAAKKDLFAFLNKNGEKKKQNGPTCLTLELRHGDMVVMHGAEIQKFWEHGVQPKGKLRYALTGRYIKPENIDPREHWKGNFEIKEGEAYDGDLKLYREQFPDEAEEEEA